jgi:hypothetical protein
LILNVKNRDGFPLKEHTFDSRDAVAGDSAGVKSKKNTGAYHNTPLPPKEVTYDPVDAPESL